MDFQNQNCHTDDDAIVRKHLKQQHRLMLRREMDDLDDDDDDAFRFLFE